jgi:hypothetical protein
MYLWSLDADAKTAACAVAVLAVPAAAGAVIVIHTLAGRPDCLVALADAHR